MAREYQRIHEYFINLQDLQPPLPQYSYQYDMQPLANGAPAYELTVGAGVADNNAYGCVDATGTPGVLVVHPSHAHPNTHTHVPTQPSHDRKRKSPQRHECRDDVSESSINTEHSQQYSRHQNDHMHDPRKRNNLRCSDDVASCDVRSTSSASTNATYRKKKNIAYSTSSMYDDDGTDDTKSNRSISDKKQNHSEIEKRRRDKMNNYISELSSMVPMCGAMARKLDKLTVLRMAVQHIRSIRGALSAGPLTVRPRPAFLTERELNALVLQTAKECFLMVIGCDRGRLLYASTSVTRILHYDQSELLGQSLFDILHPKDVAKVKEQLSSSDLSPRERLIDAKTMLPLKADFIAGASRFCPGARRSFFCRIKSRAAMEATATVTSNSASSSSVNQVKEEAEPNDKSKKKQPHDKKYVVIQYTGYLKSWAPVEMCEAGNLADGMPDDGEACNLSCLVAVGRPYNDLKKGNPPVPQTRLIQYISRHATDGKFIFVDQRVTLALGFLPQELLGTSLYEYISGIELGTVARIHKAALLRRELMKTPAYCFKKKDGTYARIQTQFKPFKNPWTKEVECLVANNTLVTDNWEQPSLDDYQEYDIFNESGPFFDDVDSRLSEADLDMQRLIDSQIESHKIGSTIAEEALRRSSTEYSPGLPSDMLQDAVFNQQSSLVDNILGVDMDSFNNEIRNNVPLSSVGAEGSPPPEINDIHTTSPPPSSPPLPPLDGNGEAAMAVIMSLLEADAGLGGPVNFSGLPWPLP